MADEEDDGGLSVMSKSSLESEKGISTERGSTLTFAVLSFLGEAEKLVGSVNPRSISLSHVLSISSRGMASEQW